MSSPVYTFIVPSFIGGLKALSTVLKKGEEYAQENNIPLQTLVDASLYKDMKPLSFQVFVATSTALKTVARAQLTEPADFKYSETTTYADFYVSIDEAIAQLEALKPSDFAGKEESKFKAPMGPGVEFEFTPASFATSFGLPNFFFHVNTAYGILRSRGVPIGKRDYLGSFVAASTA